MNHQAVSVINQGRGEANQMLHINLDFEGVVYVSVSICISVPRDLRYMSSPLLELEVSLQFQNEEAMKSIGSAWGER